VSKLCDTVDKWAPVCDVTVWCAAMAARLCLAHICCDGFDVLSTMCTLRRVFGPVVQRIAQHKHDMP